jgi:UDP-glucose 4-epimerase
MHVAITGGGGFIGRHLQNDLRARGHEVTVLELPRNDVSKRVLLPLTADGVIHLAGVLGTHELFDEPQRAIDVNITGTLNVLEAAKAVGARYVGMTMPRVFPSIYTATKTAAAELERAYHYAYDMPISRVRAFNAYGTGQKFGPGHPQKIIPTFARASWLGDPMPIWGDGEQTVDLICVKQLARMLVCALDVGDDETIDGGCGIAMSVNDVARMVGRITGNDRVEHLPMRRGELPVTIVAKGEGWECLDFHPFFDEDTFYETVVSYRESEGQSAVPKEASLLY